MSSISYRSLSSSAVFASSACISANDFPYFFSTEFHSFFLDIVFFYSSYMVVKVEASGSFSGDSTTFHVFFGFGSGTGFGAFLAASAALRSRCDIRFLEDAGVANFTGDFWSSEKVSVLDRSRAGGVTYAPSVGKSFCSLDCNRFYQNIYRVV